MSSKNKNYGRSRSNQLRKKRVPTHHKAPVPMTLGDRLRAHRPMVVGICIGILILIICLVIVLVSHARTAGTQEGVAEPTPAITETSVTASPAETAVLLPEETDGPTITPPPDDGTPASDTDVVLDEQMPASQTDITMG